QFQRLVTELDDAGAGPRVAVENMFALEALGRRVDPFRYTDDPHLTKFAALTLDTSHAGADRRDLLELYDGMRGRVRHVHLSDSTSTRGDEHMPMGTGTLPLAEF